VIIREISQDEHERASQRSRRMAEHDRYSDIATAEERGEIRSKLEVAKNMRTQGFKVDDIERATGLTVNDILRL